MICGMFPQQILFLCLESLDLFFLALVCGHVLAHCIGQIGPPSLCIFLYKQLLDCKDIGAVARKSVPGSVERLNGVVCFNAPFKDSGVLVLKLRPEKCMHLYHLSFQNR